MHNNKIYSEKSPQWGHWTTQSPAVTKLWRPSGKISLIFRHGLPLPDDVWQLPSTFFYLVTQWLKNYHCAREGGSWHIYSSGNVTVQYCLVPKRGTWKGIILTWPAVGLIYFTNILMQNNYFLITIFVCWGLSFTKCLL